MDLASGAARATARWARAVRKGRSVHLVSSIITKWRTWLVMSTRKRSHWLPRCSFRQFHSSRPCDAWLTGHSHPISKGHAHRHNDDPLVSPSTQLQSNSHTWSSTADYLFPPTVPAALTTMRLPCPSWVRFSIRAALARSRRSLTGRTIVRIHSGTCCARIDSNGVKASWRSVEIWAKAEGYVRPVATLTTAANTRLENGEDGWEWVQNLVRLHRVPLGEREREKVAGGERQTWVSATMLKLVRTHEVGVHNLFWSIWRFRSGPSSALRDRVDQVVMEGPWS
ncbi:hypothetical protein P280DRAFT_288791 [Massarina eburnea CBS 473.64]|uniref:Uncharacterized protein n=1 Tax=Massarina eburnea CBS 473.64 TaxID=1395130 RepID=A0A6A6S318_9PLEO|nr:hypothetical protein P280DRAFT_288791 [Massarina eburnea CBS 473.64]